MYWMNKYQVVLVVVCLLGFGFVSGLTLGAVLVVPEPADVVNLEWRPAQQLVEVGDTVAIGLYATGDDRPFVAAQIIITWDSDILGEISVVGNGPYEWQVLAFWADSGGDCINCDLANGDAWLLVGAQLGGPWPVATPEGLLVGTLEFEAIAAGTSTIEIPLEIGVYTTTAVFDHELPGLKITGDLGTATVEVQAQTD